LIQIERHEVTGKLYYQVSVSHEQAGWQRRQHYHGCALLVASAGSPPPVAEIAQLYRVAGHEKPRKTVKSGLGEDLGAIHEAIDEGDDTGGVGKDLGPVLYGNSIEGDFL
jgi:hypothetical protein